LENCTQGSVLRQFYRGGFVWTEVVLFLVVKSQGSFLEEHRINGGIECFEGVSMFHRQDDNDLGTNHLHSFHLCVDGNPVQF
jgi:hypothetical protein